MSISQEDLKAARAVKALGWTPHVGDLVWVAAQDGRWYQGKVTAHPALPYVQRDTGVYTIDHGGDFPGVGWQPVGAYLRNLLPRDEHDAI